MSNNLVVDWKKPEETPAVNKYDMETFWVAVKYTNPKGEVVNLVFDALYINKPLEYASDDKDFENPLDDDHHVDVDGYPVSSVGWHRPLNHADFSNYYEKLNFSSNYEFLGWADYIKPEFK